MHSHLKRAGAAILAALAMAGSAAADVIYQQAGTGAACAGACWTSSFGDGVGFQAYDNFTLSADAQITGATWRGFIQSASGTEAVDPTITSWQVSFSADSGGAPGAILASSTFAAADVTTTFLGVSSFSGPVNVYEFSVALPAAFAATAGTTYWFSPFASQPHFYPFFSWSPAVATGDDSFQVSRPDNTTFVRSGDRAFSLLGGVPEPAAWTVMLLGFGGVGAVLRRRRGEPVAA